MGREPLAALTFPIFKQQPHETENAMNLNDNLSRHANFHTQTRSNGEAQHSDLVRFSVAMPEDLLMDFDQLVSKRGIAKNRSEVIRDLVREALVDAKVGIPGTQVMGTLTIMYSHHSNDLQDKLHAIQHDSFENIISTMHVHVDQHTCLEVIIIRGETYEVQDIANTILGTKGVQNGKLVITTVDD
jgi:CopG family nickel-responsive transcriptional regulator